MFVGICIEEATHWKSTIGIWRLKTFKKHFILKFLVLLSGEILPVKKRLILSHPFKVLLFCEYGKEKWPWNQRLINGCQGEKVRLLLLYLLSSFVPPSSTLLCTVFLMHKSGVQKSTCLISLTMTQQGIVQVFPSGKAHGRGLHQNSRLALSSCLKWVVGPWFW